MLSAVSADTDTFEVDGELLEPVYDAVRAELCQEAATVRNKSSGWGNQGFTVAGLNNPLHGDVYPSRILG
jgi:hypothetical protein